MSGFEVTQMDEKEEARPRAWRATVATQLVLRSKVQEAPTGVPCGGTHHKTGGELYAYNSSLGGISSTPAAATLASSFDQLRGARLLRSFIYRRRLGLLKGGPTWTTGEGIFPGVREVTSEAAAGPESDVPSSVSRDLPQNETDSRARGPGAALCGYVKGASGSASTAYANASVRCTRLERATRVFAVSANGETPANAEDCSPRYRRHAVLAEKYTGSVQLSMQPLSVEAVLSPFSHLRLQLASSAAAKLEAAASSAAASVSAGVPRGLSDTHVDRTLRSGVPTDSMSLVDRETQEFRARGGRTCKRLTTSGPTVPANLQKRKPTVGSRVRRALPKIPASNVQLGREDGNTSQPAKRRSADTYQDQPPVHAKVESTCTPSYVWASGSREGPNEKTDSTRTRYAFAEEEEDSSGHLEPHHILIEQQQEAVAAAEATAAMLRRKVQALQAENDRLLSRWGHATGILGHDKSTLMYRDINAYPSDNDVLGRCDSGREHAVFPIANKRQNSLEARDEIQILKQQLAICRREVQMLSQENDYLREMCSRKK